MCKVIPIAKFYFHSANPSLAHQYTKFNKKGTQQSFRLIGFPLLFYITYNSTEFTAY